jgi:hypothetical protein
MFAASNSSLGVEEVELPVLMLFLADEVLNCLSTVQF